jgi:hypothetical protein
LFPDCLAVLQQLKAQGHTLALVTRRGEGLFEHTNAIQTIREYFTIIQSLSEDKLPSKMLAFRKVMQQTGFEPHQTICIDDAAQDYHQVIGAGLIKVPKNFFSIESISKEDIEHIECVDFFNSHPRRYYEDYGDSIINPKHPVEPILGFIAARYGGFGGINSDTFIENQHIPGHPYYCDLAQEITDIPDLVEKYIKNYQEHVAKAQASILENS